MAIPQQDLRNVSIFAPLFANPDESSNRTLLQALTRAGTLTTWRKDSTIFSENRAGDCMFVLKNGRAKVVLENRQGRRELILAILKPNDIVGILAPLDGYTRSASLITLERTDVIEIPRQPLVDAIRTRADLACQVLLHLGGIIRDTNEQLRTICMYQAGGRALRRLFLSGTAKDYHDEVVVTDCPTIQQIAQMLGTERETISKALSQLEEKQVIRIKRKGPALEEVTLTKRAINRYLPGLHLPVE